jgi:hypothetical protein
MLEIARIRLLYGEQSRITCGPTMARVLCCIECRGEFVQIRLADRSTVVICVQCDVIGNAHEVRLGARLLDAESGRRRS